MVVTAQRDGHSFDEEGAMPSETKEKLAAWVAVEAAALLASVEYHQAQSDGIEQETIEDALQRVYASARSEAFAAAAKCCHMEAAAIEEEDVLAAHVLRATGRRIASMGGTDG